MIASALDGGVNLAHRKGRHHAVGLRWVQGLDLNTPLCAKSNCYLEVGFVVPKGVLPDRPRRFGLLCFGLTRFWRTRAGLLS